MVYLKTAQEWLDQSKLLLQARPATTKITTRYSISPVKPRATTTEPPAKTTSTQQEPPIKQVPPRGCLVLKTYDPVSGVVLKYRTTKAYEVSRLIQSSLGRLGRDMAGLPDEAAAVVGDEIMPDAPSPVEDKGVTAAAAASATATTQGGGGGKKKKKGKK